MSDDWRQERAKTNWKSSQSRMAMSSVARKMNGCGEENISSRSILDDADVIFHLSDVFLDSV
jgi:hypothetical protein